MCIKENNNNLKTLLIIDNEKHFLNSLKLNLGDDFEIEVAETTEDAFLILKDCNPSAIILDWRTPKLGGREFCQKLRSDTHFDFIPILVLSAYDTTVNRPISYQVGADDFLSKPVTISEIRHKIELLVNDQQFSKNLEAKIARRKKSK